MSLKAKIKNLIGPNNLRRVKVAKGYLRYCATHTAGGELMLKSTDWEAPQVFALPDKHTFFGYYDLQQIRGEKLLLMAVDKKANPAMDEAELYWVDTDNGEYHKFGNTRAWCWQQGCRLRWHPTQENTVLFNAIKNGRYVCRVLDLEQGIKRTLYRPLYDLSPTGDWGLSLNFSRLQRLRPGYGYGVLPDATYGQLAPEDDGIFWVDTQNGESRLIVSYAQLAELTPEAREYENYVNHIAIAPDGSRFLFFHLWKKGHRWNGRLYIARPDGSELRCMEEEFIPSHYCWNGPNQLLITSVGFGGSASYYYLYDLSADTRRRLPPEGLNRDGHPGFFEDGHRFITDTYPDEKGLQRLLAADIEGNCEDICRLYSDPRLFDERRCDLHPRLTPDGRTITVDSTFRNGKRSVLLLRHK